MGILEILRGKKQGITDAEIQPGELKGAGVAIAKGDPRLKGGITRDNLDDKEREKLDRYRQKKNES